MKKFRDIDDVRDWLEPMDYTGFWYAIEPYGLMLQPRGHCDQQIADGEAEKETVLAVLKAMARIELTEKLGLKWREEAPWLKLVDTH